MLVGATACSFRGPVFKGAMSDHRSFFLLIGTVMCAGAPNLAVFLPVVLFLGLQIGVFVPTAYALVGDQVPYEYRGKVMGLIVSSWSLSLVLGVPIGAFIGQSLNWRWTFWIFRLHESLCPATRHP
ncbi:MFS transporter [Bacillus sp. SL00103]